MYTTLEGTLVGKKWSDVKDMFTNVRVLRDGKENIVTADYKPERLNVYLDNDGVIKRASYG